MVIPGGGGSRSEGTPPDSQLSCRYLKAQSREIEGEVASNAQGSSSPSSCHSHSQVESIGLVSEHTEFGF